MPRTPRVEYSGGICQVMSRGDRREDLFQGDEERHTLLNPRKTIQQILPRLHLGTASSARRGGVFGCGRRRGWRLELQRGQRMNGNLCKNKKSEGLTPFPASRKSKPSPRRTWTTSPPATPTIPPPNPPRAHPRSVQNGRRGEKANSYQYDTPTQYLPPLPCRVRNPI